jgi:hypothetical protein
MPFVLRPCLRFPLQSPLSYNAGPFQDRSTVWNLSRSGSATPLDCLLSEDLQMHPQSQHHGGEAGNA